MFVTQLLNISNVTELNTDGHLDQSFLSHMGLIYEWIIFDEITVLYDIIIYNTNIL